MRSMQMFHPQQAFFPEVFSPDEHSSAVSHWEEAIQRRETRKARQLVYRTLRREQLEAPLFDILGGDIETFVPECAELAAASELFDQGERVLWSEKAMIDMHEVLLHGSLNAFRCRGNPDEKADVLRWIFEEPYQHGTIRVRGEEVMVFNDEVPFSFDSCCRYVGVNPEKLRDTIEIMVEKRAKRGLSQ